MKIIWSAGLSLCVTACAGASTSSPGNASNPASTRDTSNASLSPGVSLATAFTQICQGKDSLPMEVLGSRHFVSLKVTGPSGSAFLRFHVDTGGNTRGLLLTHSAAEKLGARAASDLSPVIGFGDHDLSLPEGAFWNIGTEEYESFDHATRKGLSAGQIGAGFLSRYLVCIDPKGGRFGIAAPGSLNIADSAHPPIPLLMLVMGNNNAKYPFLLTHFRQGRDVAAGYGMLLDTGATTSMLEAGKIDVVSKVVSHTAIAVGAAGDADMISPKNGERMLRVGNIVLTAPAAKFPNTPTIEGGPATFIERPDGTWDNMFGYLAPTRGAYGAVANDVLDSFRLIIDYQRETVWLDPTGRPTDRSASLSRVGVALRFAADGCPTIVTITNTNSRDTLAALQVGDVILSVDGADACKAMHHEIETALSGPPGSHKKLSVRRGSATLDLDTTTAALLPVNP